MFEGLVAGLLNQYLGEFIHDVKTDDLSAAVWSGEVCLKNLKVKTEALDFLQLPIEVVSGYINKIFLKANWSRLGSKPVVVEIDTVYLIARPRENFTSERSQALESAVAAKLRKLLAWQQLKLASPELKQSGDVSWTEKLTFKIVNNLQLSVRRVHVRFEGAATGTCPCIGLCLRELKVRTTDEKWEEKFMTDHKADVLYKKLTLTGLGVYMSTAASPKTSIEKLSEYFEAKDSEEKGGDGDDGSVPTEYQHIVPPISGHVHLAMQTDSSPKLKKPKNAVEARINALGVRLAESQYHSLLGILSRLSRSQAQIDAAFGAIRFKAKGTREERAEYIRLYKRTLNAEWEPELGPTEIKRKDAIERELSFECLAKFRAAALAELRHQLKDGVDIMTREDMNKQKQQNRGYLSSFLGWGASVAGPKVSEEELAKKREEMYHQLDYDPEEELQAEELRNARPKEYINYQLEFVMPEFFVDLRDAVHRQLVYFVGSDTRIEMTGFVQGLRARVRLSRFSVVDHYTPGTLFRNLVSQDGAGDGKRRLGSSATAETEPLLDVKVELEPLDQSADTKVDVRLRGSTIAVNAGVLSRLGAFMTPAENIDSVEMISGWSSRQATYLTDATTATLSQSFASYSQLWVSFRCDAPTFVVPRDVTEPESDVLVVDLGQFEVKTELQAKSAIEAIVRKVEQGGFKVSPDTLLSGLGADASSNAAEGGDAARAASPLTPSGDGSRVLSTKEARQFYDCFVVHGAELQVYLTRGGPGWRSRRVEDLILEKRELRKAPGAPDWGAVVSPSTVITPFDLRIRLYKSVAPGVGWLPKTRVEAHLPVIDLGMSPSKYRRLLAAARAVTAAPKAGKRRRRPRRTRRKKKLAKSSKGGGSSPGQPGKGGASQISQDTSGLKGNILDAKENQTYADLKHSLGSLPEVDADAKALLDEAKATKGGVPIARIRKWWEKRLARLEAVTSLLVRFTAGRVAVTLCRDGASPCSPTAALAVADLANFGFGLAQRYFDSRTVMVLSRVRLRDVESPYECADVVSTRGGERSNFVRVELTTVKPDSPSRDRYPSASNACVEVGGLTVLVEPERVGELAGFLLNDFLGPAAAASPKRKPAQRGVRGGKSAGAKAKPGKLKTFMEAVTAQTMDHTQEKDYYYLKKMKLRINLRSEPSVSKELMTGLLIEQGSVFKAVERREGKNGQVFLKIQQGDKVGWAFMKHPGTGQALVVPFAEIKVDRSEIVQQALDLRFGELRVDLNWRGRTIATAAATGLTASVKQNRFSQDVKMTLSAVRIKDCTPKGQMYPDIVTTLAVPAAAAAVVADDAKASPAGDTKALASGDAKASSADPCLVRLEYKTHDPHEKCFPGHRVAILGSFRGLRVVYSARFLDEIKAYFTMSALAGLGQPPPAPVPADTNAEIKAAVPPPVQSAGLGTAPGGDQGLLNASAVSLTPVPGRVWAAAEDKGSGYKDPAKTFSRVRVSLSAIELWVPESSGSEQRLGASIDSIQLSNEIRSSASSQGSGDAKELPGAKLPNRAEFRLLAGPRNYQRFSVVLSRFAVTAHIRGCESSVVRLGPVRLEADALSEAALSLSALAADLGEVRMDLNQAEYQLLMRTLSGNVAEKRDVVMTQSLQQRLIAREVDVGSRAGAASESQGLADSDSEASTGSFLTSTTSATNFTSTLASSSVAAAPPPVPCYSLLLVDARLPRLTLQLALGGGPSRGGSDETPLVRLDLEDFGVGVQRISLDEHDGTRLEASCRAMSLADESPEKPGRRMLAPFRDIFSVTGQDGEARAEGLGAGAPPVQLRVTQNGGVDLESIRTGDPVAFRPRDGTRVMVWVHNLRFMLHQVLFDLATFFNLPGEVLKDGWVQQEGYARRFLSLQRVAQGSASPPRHVLQYAMDAGGIPTGSIELSEAYLEQVDDDAFVLRYGSKTGLFKLPSRAERDDWVKSIRAAIQEGAAGRSSSPPDPAAPTTGALQQQEVATTATGSSPPLTVRACMTNPCVLLVRDPYAERTEGLALSWALNAKYRALPGVRGGTAADVALEDIQVLHAAMDASKPFRWYGGRNVASSGLATSVQSMIRPFSLWMDVEMYQSEVGSLLRDAMPPLPLSTSAALPGTGGPADEGRTEAVEANIRVSAIVAQLRWNDYKLIMMSLSDFTEKLSGAASRKSDEPSLVDSASEAGSMASDSKKAAPDAGVGSSTGDEKAPVAMQGRSAAAEASASASGGSVVRSRPLPAGDGRSARVEPNDGGEKKTAAPKQVVNVSIEKIDVTLINDAVNIDIPIGRVMLDQTAVQLRALSHGKRVLLSSHLRVDYHNTRLSVWEPMLEPWNMRARVLMLDEPKIPSYYSFLPSEATQLRSLEDLPRVGRTFVDVRSDKPLELNVTAGMVTSVQQSVALLTNSGDAADGAAPASMSSVGLLPCRVENKTELPLSVRIYGNEAAPCVLAPGAAMPFTYSQSEPEVSAEAVLVVVGPASSLNSKPLATCRGWQGVGTIVSAQRHFVRLTVRGSFPPAWDLRRGATRFLRVLQGTTVLVVSAPSANRHAPVWYDLSFDTRQVRPNGEPLVFQCIDDAKGRMWLRVQYPDLLKMSPNTPIQLESDQGKETNAALTVVSVVSPPALRLAAPEAKEGRSETVARGDSWVFFPGFDMKIGASVTRPDLAGNPSALMRFASRSGLSCFNLSGELFAAREVKGLGLNELADTGAGEGLYVSLPVALGSSYVARQFERSPVEVHPLRAVLRKPGFLAATVLVPGTDAKRPAEPVSRGAASVAGHKAPWGEMVLQTTHVVSAQSDFASTSNMSRRSAPGGEPYSFCPRASIHYSVRLERGVRVLAVHSPYKLVNETAVALRVRVLCNGSALRPSTYPYTAQPSREGAAEAVGEVKANQGSGDDWLEVGPGATAYLPVMASPPSADPGFEASFSVRPTTSVAWSSPTLPLEYAALPPPRRNARRSRAAEPPRLETLWCKGTSAGDFFVSAQVGTGATDGMPRTVRFFPAVVVKNLMPDAVQFAWEQKGGDGLASFSLEPGAERAVYRLDPSRAFGIRVQMRSIAEEFSSPAALPPPRELLRGGAAGERKRVRLILKGQAGRTLAMCVEITPLANKAVVTVFAEYWLFDMTSLNLEVSEDRATVCPQRNESKTVSSDARALAELGEEVGHAQLFSFFGKKSKMYLRASPRGPGSPTEAPMPRIPASITQGPVLDRIAISLKKRGAFRFEAGERLLYHYSRQRHSVYDCVFLTTHRLARVESARLKQRILISRVQRATCVLRGSFSTDEVRVMYKNGRRDAMKIWGSDAAQFFMAMVNYLGNRPRGSNVAQAVRSEWSKQHIVANARSEGAITLRATHPALNSRHKAQYEVGYSVGRGSGAWMRTRIVKLVPRFIVINNTEHWVALRQEGTVMKDDMCLIRPGASVPFHWPSQTARKRLSFRRLPPREGVGRELEDGWQWSGWFGIDTISDRKMMLRNASTLAVEHARVEVRNGGPTRFVVVSQLEGTALLPYRIENRCSREAFFVRQVGWGAHNAPGSPSDEFSRGGWLSVLPYRHRALARHSVTMGAKFEIAVDESLSDSSCRDAKRRGGGSHLVVDLDASEKKRRPQRMRMSPRWDGAEPYDVHVFVETCGSVKVIVLSEEEPARGAQTNPYSLQPLDKERRQRLQRRAATLRQSIRVTDALLSRARAEHDRAVTATDTTRARPRAVARRDSALQVSLLRANASAGSKLYALVEFGDQKQKVSMRDGVPEPAKQTMLLRVDGARKSTVLRIILMLSQPLWTDECLGAVEFRLDDFSSHQPVRRRFTLKRCDKKARGDGKQARGQPWETPPCSVSSKSDVRGSLDLDVWWVPRETSALRARIASLEARAAERRRVLAVFGPKLELSAVYHDNLAREVNKLIARRVSPKDALKAAPRAVAAGTARVSLRVLRVVGRALDTYGLLRKGSAARLCCVVTVTATGQATGSLLVSGGTAVAQEWFDALSFDIPRSFLASASRGDQRGRVTVTLYVESPRLGEAEVGFEARRLGTAVVDLGQLEPKSGGADRKDRSLREDARFQTRFEYDASRAKSNLWEGTDYRWLTVGRGGGDEVSVLVHCTRSENGAAKEERPMAQLSLALPRMGVSLVDKKPKEILYFSVSDALLLCCDSDSQSTVEVCVGRVQLDNQLPGVSFPIVLAPRLHSSKETRPMFQFAVSKSKRDPSVSSFSIPMGADARPVIRSAEIPGSSAPIRYLVNPHAAGDTARVAADTSAVYSYISFLLQEFELNVEESLYWTLMAFVNELRSVAVASDEGDGSVDPAGRKAWVQPAHASRVDAFNIPPSDVQTIVIGLLHLQSMRVKFSFEMAPKVREKGLLLDLPFDPTAILMTLFGNTLGAIEDMKLQFNSLLLENVSTSRDSLTSTLFRHYRNDLLEQWYKVVFGFEMIGNPVGMMNDIAGGAWTFFVSPAEGFVANPGIVGIGEGFKKGTFALLESAISGAFGAAGKVTGSISKGLAALSMDDEFIAKNKSSNKAKPKHVVDGLLSGAKSIGQGLFGGIAGIVTDPMKGAKKGGFKGFFKGAAKGILGVVAKPTAGVVNAASTALKSVGNTATLVLSEKKSPVKARPPRYVAAKAQTLTPFSSVYAMGAAQLKKRADDEPILTAAITNGASRDNPGAPRRYASPSVRPAERKASKAKGNSSAAGHRAHLVVVTNRRVILKQLGRERGLFDLAKNRREIATRNVHRVVVGKSTSTQKWGVQIAQKTGKQPLQIWCSDQTEAESLKRKLDLHINVSA